NDALVLTDGVGNHVTLDIQGSFSSSSFTLSSDGSAGTDIVLSPVPNPPPFADFLAHSKSDLLMQDNTDQLVVDEVVSGQATFRVFGSFGAVWQFAGVGDYLGQGEDGYLLWNSTDGSLDVVEGGTQRFLGGVLGSQWQFEGSGDLLGYGQDDYM